MSLLIRFFSFPSMPAAVVGMFLFFSNAAVYAQTGGLTRATTGLNTFKSNLTIIIPIIAIIALSIIGLLYAADMIRKETMWNWLIGIIVAGSAAEATAMFFG